MLIITSYVFIGVINMEGIVPGVSGQNIPLTFRDVEDFEKVFAGDKPPHSGKFTTDPDYFGHRYQGHTATDQDWVHYRDILLSARVLFEAIAPESGVIGMNGDKLGWLCPILIVNGRSTFSMEDLHAPPCIIDKCTATSELQTLAMQKHSRQYTMEMYGVSIALSTELIQRGNEKEVQTAYKVKTIQAKNCIAMTLQQVVYSSLFSSPTLEYMEFRRMKDERNISKSELFYGTYQTRADMFLAWNLRRTNTKGVLVDLDNSLTYWSNNIGEPDAIICHPCTVSVIGEYAMPARDDEVREVYYINEECNNQVVYEDSIKVNKFLSYRESPPPDCTIVNGKLKRIIACPDVISDGQKTNLSEIRANFKSFNVIGYCPLPKRKGGLLKFDEIISVDWNSILVTDFEKRDDTRISIERVMEEGSYFLTETYNPAVYNNFLNSVDYNDIAQMSAVRYNSQMNYDAADKRCLLDPSRKVFYDAQDGMFKPAVTYGHSNISTCPIERGDIVAGMTMMAKASCFPDYIAEENICLYMRKCLSLSWNRHDLDSLRLFEQMSFKDALKANDTNLHGHITQDICRNNGVTRFTNYNQLIITQYACNHAVLEDKEDKKKVKMASDNISAILNLVDTLYDKYKATIASRPDVTHSWLFLHTLGQKTLQKCFIPEEEEECEGEELNELLNKASIYQNVILRAFSPRVYVMGATTFDEAIDNGLVEIVEQLDINLNEGVYHCTQNFRTLCAVGTFNTLAPASCIHSGNTFLISKFHPLYSSPAGLDCEYSRRDHFLNDNYSFRAEWISNSGYGLQIRCFALLFISMLQNPATTRALASRGVFLNTAFMLFRNITQITCGVVMARSGKQHRYLCCGNCKSDSNRSNASSYTTDIRLEAAKIDKDPINNTRVQYHVAGLGYISGMGTRIWDPFEKEKGGDFVVVPMAPCIDISEWSHIQPVNGRVSQADGNSIRCPTEMDEVQRVFTNNPWGTAGFSEAQVILGGQRHPLWSYNEPEHGVYRAFLQAKQPITQYKVGLDEFYRPVEAAHMHSESNVAMQGRQYHDNTACPIAFKTLNRGFYGREENSSNDFQSLLNIANVRHDEGMRLMDYNTCKLTVDSTDSTYIETGIKKKFKPNGGNLHRPFGRT